MKRSTGLLVLALCMFAGRAAADEATAVKLSEEASSAFEKKDYRTAAAKFEAAYKEAPRGAVLFNAGLSWDAAGDHPRAADDLAQALARADLRPQEAAQAQKRLEELRAQLGVLDIRAPRREARNVACSVCVERNASSGEDLRKEGRARRRS